MPGAGSGWTAWPIWSCRSAAAFIRKWRGAARNLPDELTASSSPSVRRHCEGADRDDVAGAVALGAIGKRIIHAVLLRGRLQSEPRPPPGPATDPVPPICLLGKLSEHLLPRMRNS